MAVKVETAVNENATSADDRAVADALNLSPELMGKFFSSDDSTEEIPAEEEEESELIPGDEITDGNEEETETDEEESEVTEEDEPKPAEAKGIAAMQKRIDEITAARRTAEEQRDALQARLEAAIKPPTPTADDPLADVMDETTLTARLEQAQAIKVWAFKNLEGGLLPDGKGGEKEFSAEEVRDLLTRADTICSAAPKRVEYLRNVEAINQLAVERYPELADKNSKEAQTAQEILKNLPELRRFANYKMVLGHIVAGLRAELADTEAAKANTGKKDGKAKVTAEALPEALKPKGKDPIAPASPRRGEATARVAERNAEKEGRETLTRIANSKGSERSLTEAFM